MSLPAVLIRKSTGDILKQANYPNIDLTPIQGLDPNLEWLLKYTPYPAPDYDSRIWVLVVQRPDLKNMVQTSTLDDLPNHPEHTNIRMYETLYTTEKRSNEEIILAIENAEESANQKLMTYRTNDKLHSLAVGILTRMNEGVTPSIEEQDILDKVKSFDVNIWKNDAEKNAKILQVNSGIEPDIDAGWEIGDTNVGI